MYIQEITIEGFKSYAQRVTLSNFDTKFNAITGLNGSGKSNILDSICFVLGIKNLSQVRAQNLQELVYKQGQAGITKASVSITFCNDNPEFGPQNYADCRQITITRQVVIGGKNKYSINGHAAQEGRVTDLFHSVQLNVNNPHFLIMQGRITKVLNMKPMEILSLLEEACGTRMYEKKREKAILTLEKKQHKLDEIDTVIDQDLRPSLEKLKQDNAQFKEYQDLSSLRDRTKRFIIAYDYSTSEKTILKLEEDIKRLSEAVTTIGDQRQQCLVDMEEKASTIRDLQTEKEIQAGGEILELQKQEEDLSKKLARDTSVWKNKNENLTSEVASHATLLASLKELEDQDFEKQVQNAEAARDTAAQELAASEAGFEASGREVAGVEAGDGRDESNRTMAERLADARNQAEAAGAQAKQAELKVKHTSGQLSEKRKLLAAKEKEGAGVRKELAKHESIVAEKEGRLTALNFNEAEQQRLESSVESETQEVRRCKEEVDRAAAGLGGVEFTYRKPHARFDDTKVRGVLAKLLKLKRPETSLALEVAAGGKLYQVVVDDQEVAKEILEKGALAKQWTMIPLSKIKYRDLPESVLAAAQRMSNGKAVLALDLINFLPDLTPAMKYAFGNVFICEDAGTAKKLAYSREVGVRCVTLEGDDFNPSGTLTGGSRGKGASLLARLATLQTAEAELERHQRALEESRQGLAQLANASKEYKKLKQDLDLSRHSLELLRQNFAGSEVSVLTREVEELTTAATAAEEEGRAAATKKAEMIELAASLEREIKDFSKERDKRMKAAVEKQRKAKAAVEAAKKVLKTAEQSLAATVAERDSAGTEQQQLAGKIKAAERIIEDLRAEVVTLETRVTESRAIHAEVAARLTTRKARLKECDAEIAALEKERRAIERRAGDLDNELRKAEGRVKTVQENARKSAQFRETLEKDYLWILQERASFGQGDYNFSAHDPDEVRRQYQDAEGRVATLKGRVNAKAQALLAENERELDKLLEKRQAVENDKNQIQKTIQDLDAAKKVAIEKAWVKVNEDFGRIFSTLLPGTEAKLDPPEGQTFEAGLEVRVAFGGVWKESLTELSGGQRSLIALSMVLAFCKWKPAPIYILDEVDAALDLNHTQNIGRMIREHFPMSQFIVVSLKEGMFSNANVIFRTKFVDGVSAVTRTVNVAAPEHGPGSKTTAAATVARSRTVLQDRSNV